VAVALAVRLTVPGHVFPGLYFGFYYEGIPTPRLFSAEFVAPAFLTLLALWIPVSLAFRIRSARKVGVLFCLLATLFSLGGFYPLSAFWSLLVRHEGVMIFFLGPLWSLLAGSLVVGLISLSGLYLWFSRDVRNWLCGEAGSNAGGR
jgi:hypothetical protein